MDVRSKNSESLPEGGFLCVKARSISLKMKKVEVQTGFEPVYVGFADRCVSVLHHCTSQQSGKGMKTNNINSDTKVIKIRILSNFFSLF